MREAGARVSDLPLLGMDVDDPVDSTAYTLIIAVRPSCSVRATQRLAELDAFQHSQKARFQASGAQGFTNWPETAQRTW